jgi:hypothetical protein
LGPMRLADRCADAWVRFVYLWSSTDMSMERGEPWWTRRRPDRQTSSLSKSVSKRCLLNSQQGKTTPAELSGSGATPPATADAPPACADAAVVAQLEAKLAEAEQRVVELEARGGAAERAERAAEVVEVGRHLAEQQVCRRCLFLAARCRATSTACVAGQRQFAPNTNASLFFALAL